jgi:hypothetical protein
MAMNKRTLKKLTDLGRVAENQAHALQVLPGDTALLGALEYVEALGQTVAALRKALEAEVIYCTTYCNRGHVVQTGRPVGHECRVIPPKALRAEIDGDFKLAIEILSQPERNR